MKRKISLLLAMLLCLMAVTGCTADNHTSSEQNSQSQIQQTEYQYQLTQEIQSIDLTVPSRAIEIPATLTLPAKGENALVPLVVMHHDFMGDRSTNGAFDLLAQKLAEQGIASIRMDFSGRGDSTETFRNNSLVYADADAKASQAYAIANAPIDASRVGYFGYGFGAVLSLDSGTRKDSGVKALALLAPYADEAEATMRHMFGSEFERMHKEAFSEQRYTTYTGPDGAVYEISVNWFDDLVQARPTQNLEDFSGDMLIVYSDNDPYLPAGVCTELAEQAKKTAQVTVKQVTGAGHDFGFSGEDSVMKEEVLQDISEFFAASL